MFCQIKCKQSRLSELMILVLCLFLFFVFFVFLLLFFFCFFFVFLWGEVSFFFKRLKLPDLVSLKCEILLIVIRS